jgi:adenosylcobinamide-GDP ribazoletransferase
MRVPDTGEWRADLVSAFGLLTRLPMPSGVQGSPMGRAVWAWPLVGLVVGALGAASYAIAWHLLLSPWLGGVLAVIVMALVTGGFHEDGLADTADGLGGGTTRESRLAIMKDSRIGSFGALALIFSVGLRVGAIAQLDDPRIVAAGLIAAAVIGRAAMPGVLLLSGPARPGGLGASLGGPDRNRIGIGWVAAALICLLLLTPHRALALALTGAVVAFAVGALGRRFLGGFTGDTLGATEHLAECAVLVVLVASIG